jgi:hypothetical protein
MQTAVTADLVIPVCFYFCLSLPIASASLSPSDTFVLLWRDGDTSGRNALNAWSSRSALVPGALEDGVPVPHQQEANQLGGNLLGGAGVEGVGEVLGGRGGYGCGCGRKF